MTSYLITSDAGVDMGIYEGATAEEALDAMARDAGYDDDAEAIDVARPFAGRITKLRMVDGAMSDYEYDDARCRLSDVRALQREARASGDRAQAALCRVACGDVETATQSQVLAAYRECARAIADAEAQS